ncbi:AAA family ATPase [Nesterenkonia natronophila]|uniref:Chromosome partitioning protein n=1 Tax=Nesterenkonia natronophila TaxID=2174932 RepID=A0A3A4FHP7_9MICC|nr:AAA family ATPase [Nesterenkonia natronophila]RJN31825.1 chromosome partitioning protein [Nesterenkonia natronophila]
MGRCAVITTGRLSTDHVAALERLHTDVTIDRRCADLTEVIAVARMGRADAVLIIGTTHQVTETTIHDLRRDVPAIVTISDLASERARLGELGLTAFDDAVTAAELAHALRSETSPQGQQSMVHHAEEDADFAAMMAAQGLTEAPEPSRAEHVSSTKNARGITAVWGTAGAPGRTTVAANLAAELALSGRSVLLIDADTYGASVTVHLGLLEESAGIAQVCRAAEFGNLDSEVLLRATSGVDVAHARFDVLTGLPRPHRWTELRPRALDKVLTMCRGRYDHVIVDLASEITCDHEWGYEQPAVQRNTAARTVLSSADDALVIGLPDPIGFSRLIKAVQHLAEELPEAPLPQVVVNKLRRDVVGRAPRRQLSDAWFQLGQNEPITAFLPWEPAACDGALRAGQVLAESAGDSALRQQIAALGGIEVHRGRRRIARSPGSARRARRRRPAEALAGLPGGENGG